MTAENLDAPINETTPAYVVPSNLAWIDGSEHGHEGDLYLTQLPDGRTVLLRGSSRLIWLAAIESPDVVTEVAEAAGVPSEEIAEDVNAFLRELTTQGLLTRARATRDTL